MQADPHERARFLVDEALAGGIPDADREWLHRHTGACAECRRYAELSARIVRGFQSFSFDTDPEMTARVRQTVTGHALQSAANHTRRWLFAAAAWCERIARFESRPLPL